MIDRIITFVLAFVAGAFLSVQIHGDYIVGRANENHDVCTAYDPLSQKSLGEWQPRSDNRCHLTDYLLQRLRISLHFT